MKIKDVKEALSEYPDDAVFELAKFMAMPIKNPGDEQFEVVLDLPVIGFAYHEETNHVRLVVEAGPQIMAFGKVTRIKE